MRAVGLDGGYGTSPAVRGFDLHIEEGEVAALLGANEAGSAQKMKARPFKCSAGSFPLTRRESISCQHASSGPTRITSTFELFGGGSRSVSKFVRRLRS
jgi:hypothetical protein